MESYFAIVHGENHDQFEKSLSKSIAMLFCMHVKERRTIVLYTFKLYSSQCLQYPRIQHLCALSTYTRRGGQNSFQVARGSAKESTRQGEGVKTKKKAHVSP